MQTKITRSGQPQPNPGASHSITKPGGRGGLILLQDTQLIETLAHFARERIPERLICNAPDD
jgi:catalase